MKLFQKVFFNNGQTAPSSSKLDAYFEEIFFHNPWTEEGAEEGISSLVYETADGEVTGFIGIIPRRMLLNGRPIRATVSLRFMVEPGSRSTLAAVKLLNTFFCGSPWMLTHSKNQEVLQAIYRGDLFLTRLEGERCKRFQNG